MLRPSGLCGWMIAACIFVRQLPFSKTLQNVFPPSEKQKKTVARRAHLSDASILT